MATWVRLGTGTAPTSTSSDLVGDYALDNGTVPGDFDETAVNSVRIQWSIVGTSFNDDDLWDDDSVVLETGVVEISTHAGGGSTGNQNTTVNNDATDSSISAGLSVAQWEAALVRGDGADAPDEWADYDQVKGPDGGNLAAASVTVTIDYTPAAPVVNGDGIGHGVASGTSDSNVRVDVVAVGKSAPSSTSASNVLVISTQRGHGVSSGLAVTDVVVVSTGVGHAVPSSTAVASVISGAIPELQVSGFKIELPYIATTAAVEGTALGHAASSATAQADVLVNATAQGQAAPSSLVATDVLIPSTAIGHGAASSTSLGVTTRT